MKPERKRLKTVPFSFRYEPSKDSYHCGVLYVECDTKGFLETPLPKGMMLRGDLVKTYDDTLFYDGFHCIFPSEAIDPCRHDRGSVPVEMGVLREFPPNYWNASLDMGMHYVHVNLQEYARTIANNIEWYEICDIPLSHPTEAGYRCVCVPVSRFVIPQMGMVTLTYVDESCQYASAKYWTVERIHDYLKRSEAVALRAVYDECLVPEFLRKQTQEFVVLLPEYNIVHGVEAIRK
jgi:hypothetical protein